MSKAMERLAKAIARIETCETRLRELAGGEPANFNSEISGKTNWFKVTLTGVLRGKRFTEAGEYDEECIEEIKEQVASQLIAGDTIREMRVGVEPYPDPSLTLGEFDASLIRKVEFEAHDSFEALKKLADAVNQFRKDYEDRYSSKTGSDSLSIEIASVEPVNREAERGE